MSPKAPKLLLIPSILGEGPVPTEFSAADYLQLGRAGRRTIRVEVGDGAIEMVDGTLARAVDHLGEGIDALLRLLVDGGLTGNARARCFEGEIGALKNLDIDLENALLEAARILDERERSTEEVPPELPEIPATVAPEAIELGISAVLRKEYDFAFAAFSRARELGDESELVTSNLERLASLLNLPHRLSPSEPTDSDSISL